MTDLRGTLNPNQNYYFEGMLKSRDIFFENLSNCNLFILFLAM